MSDENNAAGASGGDSNAASGAPAPEVTSLSVEDAVERLNAQDKAAEAPTEGDAAEPTGAPAQQRAKPADTPKEPPAGEPGADDADDQKDDPEALDFENLHGNTKLRLRDGSVVSVSDLKKNWGDLQEFPQRRQAMEAAATELRQREHQTAEQSKTVARILPLAMSVLQEMIPPPPPEEMWDNDPIEAGAMERAHNKAMAKLKELHQGGAQQTQAQQAQQQQRMQQYLEREGEQLFTKMPHLKEDEAKGAFLKKMTKSLSDAGFQDHEVANISDHRLFPLIEKVIKYDELMAAKPKPQQAGRPTPPQAPGRRGSAGDARQSETNGLRQALRSSGSIDDAVALLNALDRSNATDH